VTDLSGLAKHPVTTVAVGAAATAFGVAAETYKACERLPFVGGRLRDVRSTLERRGEHLVAVGLEPLKATITAVAVELVDRVLDELDINTLVRERVDLIGLADVVVAGIDLPAIIRESTGSVTADVMDDVRTQGERADDAVSGLVDRILGRDKGPR
jgi:hypothetical protein